MINMTAWIRDFPGKKTWVFVYFCYNKAPSTCAENC